MSWGERFYDHYRTHLGAPTESRTFRPEGSERSLQVLAFDEVFKGCRVFATLGLTHHRIDVQGVCELVMPVDGDWDDVPSILANYIFFAVGRRIAIRRGAAISGLENINPSFAAAHGKSALYVTDPFGIPPEFSVVKHDDEAGRVYLGLLLSQAEYDFRSTVGADAFEDVLEAANVDPYTLDRASVK